MSCGYQGVHFGAHYPDATCIDGYLWDLDSCDEPGGDLFSGGDRGCPCCNTKEYLSYFDFRPTGNASQRRKAQRAAVRKIKGWATPTQAPSTAKKEGQT